MRPELSYYVAPTIEGIFLLQLQRYYQNIKSSTSKNNFAQHDDIKF